MQRPPRSSRLVAFLRGLNVGGHRVKNEQLRSIFEAHALTGVATWIASGNVVFDGDGRDPDQLEATLEVGLQAALGYEVRTFIRQVSELRKLAAPAWLSSARGEGFNVHVIFLKSEPDGPAREGLAGLHGADDAFRVAGRQVYWLRRGGLSDAPIQPHHLARALQGQPHTARNLNTVAKISAKFGSAGSASGAAKT